ASSTLFRSVLAQALAVSRRLVFGGLDTFTIAIRLKRCRLKLAGSSLAVVLGDRVHVTCPLTRSDWSKDCFTQPAWRDHSPRHRQFRSAPRPWRPLPATSCRAERPRPSCRVLPPSASVCRNG